MNALVAILSLGLLVRWALSGPTVAKHPSEPSPPCPTPTGADRLRAYDRLLFEGHIAPCERFAMVKELHRQGRLTEQEALSLLEVLT